MWFLIYASGQGKNRQTFRHAGCNTSLIINRLQTWWSRRTVQCQSAARWRHCRLCLTSQLAAPSSTSSTCPTMTSRCYSDQLSTAAASALCTRAERRHQLPMTSRRWSRPKQVQKRCWHWLYTEQFQLTSRCTHCLQRGNEYWNIYSSLFTINGGIKREKRKRQLNYIMNI